MNGNGKFEIVARTGNPEVAEIFVGRDPSRPDRMFEFVDGLDHRQPRQEKWIVNVSTQYGCPIECLFCDAGGGYRGNIPADLLIAQVAAVLDRHDAALRHSCAKLKVHFSRMGEPALNPAVTEAIEQLPGVVRNPNLWACVATTLPEGSDAWFARLVEVKERLFRGRFQLQFSLNATDEAWRRRLMPFPHAPLPVVAERGLAFWRAGDRKVVLNFALAAGVPVDPVIAGALFDPAVFMVKLTPLNPTARGAETGLTTALCPASPDGIDRLVGDLRARGFDVVVSVGDTREDEIGSNCGQTVRRFAGDLARGGR